jgi:DNA-directed RNA polymerase beta subunit
MDSFLDQEPVEAVKFRRFDDVDTERDDIYENAKRAFKQLRPVQNATHRLEVADVDYDGPFEPTKADEKKAILQGTSLHRPLRGTVRLVDIASNKVLDEQKATLARIPHLTSRGLFIRNGVTWSLRNQARLRPGVYTRHRADGGTESHFNIKPGTGRGFRIFLEPESGLFKFQVGQSTTKLYPVLRQLGVDDDVIKQAWGDELHKKNFVPESGHDIQDIRKLVHKLSSTKAGVVPDDLLKDALKDALARGEVDEDTTELTLGERFRNLSPERLLQATTKVLKVARGEDPGDNRDSQAFQSIHSSEDYIRERLSRDQAGTLRKLLWKAGRTGKLGQLQPGVMDRNLGSIFEGSGLAMSVEDINPFEIHDQRQAITRLGEGGISSEQAVSRDARGVQPSYIGVIDAGRGPESSKLGLDLRVTDAALKGSDGQLYTTVTNRDGKPEVVSARTLSTKTVAFPGEMERDAKRIPAIRDGDITYVTKDEVDYVIPNPNALMSRATAMIPFPESVKGQRLLMGARMTAQAMPLQEPEAPLVQTADSDGVSLHEKMGATIGAVRAPAAGVVTKADADEIQLSFPDGTKKTFSLYNNYPTARKTVVHNTALVKRGDVVQPGQMLAKSNFTDDKGVAAIGRNLRVAFMAAEGDTIEDAFVISESAAKKLTSEALYKSDLDLSEISSTKKADYQAIYADRFSPDQYAKIDDDGVIQVGAEVRPGDPLILGYGTKEKRAVGALMNSPRAMHSDRAQTWEHHAPGVVTDVVRTRGGIKVAVKSYDAMRAADKLSGRHGNKGVIAAIRPDEQMPVDANGEPVEVIMNSLGIVSRTNPAALAEAMLGKVAQRTGKPYVVPGFSGNDVTEFALQEALKNGVITQNDKGELVDTETLTDPRDGRKIPGVFTGNMYFMKLQHMAESKLGARDTSTYTTEGFPAKGGKEGSKRIAMLDTHALLAAGATDFIKDAKLVRGQRNDDYWRAIRAGETPIVPTESFADENFKTLLKAAGVNVREKGTRSQLAPLLDRDVDALAQHEIDNPGTFDFESMEPIKGGLFDVSKTGGAEGNRFTKITLPQKIPHPLFVEPIQRLLGLTGKEFEAVLSGKEELHGKTGPGAVEAALSGIDVDRDIALAKEQIRTGRGQKRDDAVKRLNYLTGLKKTETTPSDLLISKIPVIPPRYRPVTKSRGTDMVHDLNYLYHDLLEARNNYSDATKEFGDAGDEYLTMWNAVRAISGVRDPVNPKTAEQGVKGVLRYAIGVGDTPKGAFYQRKVIGTAVDTVGRGVIAADKDLDIDEVGLPKDMAVKIFRPYVIRRLTRMGLPATEAIEAIKTETPMAMKALEEEMKARPVVYNRAPALHRYAYVGAWAKLRDDDAIGMPYHTLKGLGGDFDGDQINIHVPSTEEAVADATDKLMPSKNLFFTGSFETHLEPVQDYLAGLYLASTPKSGEAVRTFASAEEAKAAYARGEISARTPIRILT